MQSVSATLYPAPCASARLVYGASDARSASIWFFSGEVAESDEQATPHTAVAIAATEKMILMIVRFRFLVIVRGERGAKVAAGCVMCMDPRLSERRSGAGESSDESDEVVYAHRIRVSASHASVASTEKFDWCTGR